MSRLNLMNTYYFSDLFVFPKNVNIKKFETVICMGVNVGLPHKENISCGCV
jgi:hypothetical protein